MMSKRIRKSRWSVEFDFPQPIIQHIQSFLTTKEAAKTTILSKSWRRAWLTHPILDFDQADFEPSQHGYIVDPKFLEFAEKTLERYETSNAGIDEFRLCMKSLRYCGYGTATNFVTRALKLGPTCLTFEFEDSDFHIPDEVFRYERLVLLNAMHCVINLNREVSCWRLRFLTLEHVRVDRPDTIFRIISSCPLIETLSLCDVYVDEFGDVGHNINRHGLTSLAMDQVNFDTLLLDDLSTKFPSLTDLTLFINEGREEIVISSPTLERLFFSMQDYTVQRVELDIPSILELTFECAFIPQELSVNSNGTGWNSYLYVILLREKRLSASWFYRVSKFIDEFRFSSISLSLQVYSEKTSVYEPGDVRGLPTPEIENLDISHLRLPPLGCYVLFDGLFRICRPKVITQYKCTYGLKETNNIHFLAKRVLDARDAKVSIPNHFMYGLNDLEEARAEAYDEGDSTWRDVTLESLVDDIPTTTPDLEDDQSDELSDDDDSSRYESDDDSTYVEEFLPVFCFQLNWKE